MVEIFQKLVSLLFVKLDAPLKYLSLLCYHFKFDLEYSSVVALKYLMKDSVTLQLITQA